MLIFSSCGASHLQVNHLHVHCLAGPRNWIEGGVSLLEPTVKMMPNLHKTLALPGESFEGYGACISLDEVIYALQKNVPIRADPKIMHRARLIVWCMRRLLEGHPLTQIRARRAYERVKRNLLCHLQFRGHSRAR